MAAEAKGATGSGLDRALEWAQNRRLDASLLSGSQFDDDVRPVVINKLLPWQRHFGDEIDRPGASTEPTKAKGSSPEAAGERPTHPKAIQKELRAAAQELGVTNTEFGRWAFKPNLTGIVVIHGIGPQLAGQTLLDWTRPIITVLGDAVAADYAGTAGNGGLLAPPDPDAGGITDPVYKSNIDFSGETFPVLQIRVPRRAKETEEEKAADDPLWIFTETWWASEVRPPTLRTMVGWLGEQGGVSRIVQGIQQNMFGKGRLRDLAKVSVQPFVSVIVSFALLLLIAGLAITRLIPIDSIRSAAALKLTSVFLTDWFGGARTLLRDPAQSANVRHRLVQTIKALRAYGCQRVVIVAHSGGTIVSLTTLTDPAYPDLHVDKLITIGEALNLGWRLEASDPDAPDPQLPRGHRMLGNLGAKPRLIWRDFFGTHDPASSGPPDPPEPMRSAIEHDDRFTTERTYNQMSVLGDHGGYWDNDEHFVIPLIREIDTPNGDRSGSRFYSDDAESAIRARRKERLSFLRLWRRATNTLPIMAILAAALLTASGYLPSLGRFGMGLLASIPFAKELGDAGRALHDLGTTDVFGLQPFNAMYGLGLLVLQGAFTFSVLQALVPAGVEGLWWNRSAPRRAMFIIDLLLGPIIFAAIMVVWFFAVGVPGGSTAFRSLVDHSSIVAILIGGIALGVLARIGKWLRKELRQPQRRMIFAPDFVRGGAILMSAAFLGGLLVLLAVATLGVILVFAGSNARPAAEVETVRTFVVGALVVLVLFSLLQRVGSWRWASWDVRERYALRREPLKHHSRGWAMLIAGGGSVIAVLAAILVAVGTDGRSLPILDRGGWTMFVIGLTIGLIVLAIGKDVVDNDVEVDGRLTGSRAEGPSPTMVEPSPTGAAAGS
jgi:hypothetical protein